MENLYCKILRWSIMKLVNRQKTYAARCEKLNNIINGLVDVYCDYKNRELIDNYVKGGENIAN